MRIIICSAWPLARSQDAKQAAGQMGWAEEKEEEKKEELAGTYIGTT